jgi:hypothetical protein
MNAAVRLATIALLAPAVACAAITAADRSACTPDALKLCAAAMPDVTRVTACMMAHRSELSAACRAVVAAHQTVPHARRSPKPHAVAVPRPRPPAPLDERDERYPHVAAPPEAAAPAAPVPEPPPSAAPPPREDEAGRNVTIPVPPTERHHMLNRLENLLTALHWSTVILIVLVAWFSVRNGAPSVVAWCKRMWSTIGAGVADLRSAQTALAGDVAILKNDVEAIRAHLGLGAPAAPAAKSAGS